MEDKSYKKNAIKIVILFILAFIFIMFLPNLRTMINIRQYEKIQQELIDKKQEEQEETKKKNTLSTMICSPSNETAPNFYISYNKSGLQKYTKVENTIVTTEDEKIKLDKCMKEEKEEKGIEIKCEVNNGTLLKSIEYDFNKIDENYRKDNIFDFEYNESIEKIKNELENKDYTCG